MPTLLLSSQLAILANDRPMLNRAEHSLDEICRALVIEYPTLAAQILDVHGKVSPFVGVFVDDVQIDPVSDGQVFLPANAVVTMISAVAGG